MKATRGLQRIDQPIVHVADEIGRRAVHAVCKVVADGLQKGGTGGADWDSSTISRALSDDEVVAVARIALWVEDAAKTLVLRILTDSSEVEKRLVRAWGNENSEVRKYTKFKAKAPEGRRAGAETNQKKSADAETYYRPLI